MLSTLSVIPLPRKITVTEDVFPLTAAKQIHAGRDAWPEALALAALVQEAGGAAPEIRDDDSDALIQLGLDPALADALGPEGYTLSVTAARVTLRAAGRAGLFYGIQTLRQMLEPGGSLPGVEIEDAPRFRWRGAMLDTCRHFLPKDFILKFIDLLALHKMNTLQLHLTDDQGWRIEIKKYPKLTEVGARREKNAGRAGADRSCRPEV